MCRNGKKKSLDCADAIKSIIDHETANVNDEEGLQNKLKVASEDIRTIKVAEKLLIETLNEKDKYLKNMYDEKEKSIKCIDLKHKRIQTLENENVSLNKQCLADDEKEKGKNGLIEALKSQLKEYANRVSVLESKLDQTRINRDTTETSAAAQEHRPPPLTPASAILFHDSMCGKINSTICSKENIEVQKIWAPKLANVLEEVEEVEEISRRSIL